MKKMKTGQLLKLARLESGVSQRKFAKMYGATPQQICNIEKAEELSTRLIEKYLLCLGKQFLITITTKMDGKS